MVLGFLTKLGKKKPPKEDGETKQTPAGDSRRKSVAPTGGNKRNSVATAGNKRNSVVTKPPSEESEEEVSGTESESESETESLKAERLKRHEERKDKLQQAEDNAFQRLQTSGAMAKALERRRTKVLNTKKTLGLIDFDDADAGEKEAD